VHEMNDIEIMQEMNIEESPLPRIIKKMPFKLGASFPKDFRI